MTTFMDIIHLLPAEEQLRLERLAAKLLDEEFAEIAAQTVMPMEKEE